MIPDQLKTGFTSAISPGSAEDVAIYKTQMLGLVCLLIKRAAITAGVYVEHQDKHVVDAPEIILALKHETMRFFQTETLESDLNDILRAMSDETSVEHVNEFIQAAPESIGEASGPSGEGLVDTVLNVVESELQDSLPERVPGGDKPCECSLCTTIDDIDFLWDAWEPSDPAERFLKEHLETMIDVA